MLRRLFRNPVLIVLLVLGAAAIACDDHITPPQVTAVMADPDTPGKAYAVVQRYDVPTTPTNTSPDATILYETRDYGLSWRPSAQTLKLDPPTRRYDLSMGSETLWVAGEKVPVWSFPRPGFRQIFYPDAEDIRFDLPRGAVSNDRHGDTLYVAMGTEGVLVGTFPTPQNTMWRDIRWEVRARGIDNLNPLQLTIYDPFTIAGIIALALLCPPLMFIHRYVLRRVWGYVTTDAEAGSLALTTSMGIAVLAAIGLVLWLVDVRVDLYPVIGAMTAITVLAGCVTAFVLAQRTNTSPANRLRLVIVTGLVSLLVPAGVAAIWWLWWLVILLVFGYSVYRRTYQDEYGVYLERSDHPHPRWALDRLTLETMLPFSVLVIVMAGMLWVGPGVVYSAIGRDRFSTMVVWLAAAVLGALMGWGIKVIIDDRAAKLLMLRGASADDPDLLPKQPMRLTRHIGTVILWLLGTVVLSGILFVLQAQAYGWFSSLLR